MLRDPFQQGEQSGRIFTVQKEPIDAISATDVCRAMMQAKAKHCLSQSVAIMRLLIYRSGRISRRMNAVASTGTAPALLSIIRMATWMQHSVTSSFQSEERACRHTCILILSSMNKRLITPRHGTSWTYPRGILADLVERIAKEYRDSKQSSNKNSSMQVVGSV